jgi:hypothetical protein
LGSTPGPGENFSLQVSNKGPTDTWSENKIFIIYFKIITIIISV